MPRSKQLLQTKVMPPLQRGALVERERLQTYITAIQQHSIATVIAPAGYGKSSFLQQCYKYHQQSEKTQVFWLALDIRDDDMARFMELLVYAFQTQLPDFGHAVLQLTRSGAKPSNESLLTTFLNDVAVQSDDIYIFLDDFHILSDSSLLESISKMILRSPVNLHWIIASRTLPLDLPLGRLRALGHLLEVNENDLRFTADECKQFVHDCMQIELSESGLSLLAERTEGWIAALQLASLSLRKVEDKQAWLEGLSGRYRDIADFLTDEVLRHQHARLQEFLLKTSVLHRFNGELCEFVTGIQGCHELLEQIVHSGLFIFSLDESGDWFRYHHLFSDFLERRLQAKHSALIPSLHLKASEWFEQQQYFLDAIHHAYQANEYARAALLLERISETLFARGQIDTLNKLASRLPDEVLQQHPRLLLDIAWQYILGWNFDEGARILKSVSRYLTSISDLEAVGITQDEYQYLQSKLEHRQMMLSFISDQLTEAEALCETWLAQGYPPDPTMHIVSSVKVLLDAVRRERFQIQDVKATAMAMHELLEDRQVDYGSVHHDCFYGITLFHQAEIDMAEDFYHKAKSLAITLQGRLSTLAAMPGLLLAELFYSQNRLDEARLFINEHLENSLQLGSVDQLIAGYITKARLHVIEGQYTMAIDTLVEADKQAVRFGFKRLHAYAVAERIRLYELVRDIPSALEEGRNNGLIGSPTVFKPGDDSSITRCLMAVAWSRLAVMKNETLKTERLLKQWWEFLCERQFWRLALMVGARLTVVMAQKDDRSSARRQLLNVLMTKGADSNIRCFLDEGSYLQAVLDDIDISESPALEPLFNRLQKAFATEPKNTLVSPLQIREKTCDWDIRERELEILELAADDRTNQEIAERLAISINTVKWYWQQIFDKLDVKRRGLAVRKARDHGLIQ